MSDRVGNYLNVRPLEVGNYVSADNSSALLTTPSMLEPRENNRHTGPEVTARTLGGLF